MTKPESYWNHRIMRTKHMNNYMTYGVHEVYYRGDKVISWTDTPIDIAEESLKDLKLTLKEACKLPVLDVITGEEVK